MRSMQSIIGFIKYHNLVPIILGVVLLATASAFANEGVRNAVIGEEIIIENGIDNSLILVADLDNFDMALQIQNITEDNEKYYVDYAFRTIAIQDNRWQEVWREKRLAVSKKNLGDEDLVSYLMKELGQVVDNELAYLKEVQAIEREKGLQKIVASVKYTGLRGLLSDLREKILPEPVCQPADEVCDGIDNDCDGLIDEGLGQTTCGLGVCQVTVNNCLNGVLLACVSGTPSEEICGDGIDNNCDGIVDNPEICQPSAPPVEEGPICQPTTEACDGIDNDCDGLIDEGGVCETTEPPVEDVCDAAHLVLCITQAECETAEGFWYNEGCNTEEPPAGEEKPIEEEPPVCQPVDEVCDGLDNDCDGQIDEEVDCGTTSCDTSLNLTGQCQNACVEGNCQTCSPTCTCAEGFSDCDSDTANGCETEGPCQ